MASRTQQRAKEKPVSAQPKSQSQPDNVRDFEEKYKQSEQQEQKLREQLNAVRQERDDMSETIRNMQEQINMSTTEQERPKVDNDAAERERQENIRKQRERDDAKAREDAKRATADAGKKSGNVLVRSFKRVGPANKKEWLTMAEGYVIGFITGGRVATSDWLDRQMENAGNTGA